MDTEKKIEFYKNRNLGERFSASIDFLKENWKVLYKNILIVAIPLSLIIGFCMQYYMQSLETVATGDFGGFFFIAILFMLLAMILSMFLYSMTGAVMLKYNKGELNKDAGWSDLSGSMFSLFGKSILIGLMLFLFFILFSVVLGFMFAGMAMGTGVFAAFFILLFMVGIICAVGPSLSMIYYPAYFSGVTPWESIKQGFSLGFKNWGNIFVTLLLVGIMAGIVNTMFALPYQIVMVFSQEINIFTFIFATISTLGSVLTVPVMFIFLAFQYFSITEQEEGISLQSQIDEFDNL